MIQELIHGDCLEYMANMKDESIDLIVSDPPYLQNYKTGRRKDKLHKFCTTIDGDDDPKLIIDYIMECYRILKNDAAIYMFCSTTKIDFFKQEMEKHFTVRNIITWDKGTHSAGDLVHAFGKRCEFIILANKGQSKIQGKRIQDLWRFNRVVGKEQLHQNQKPLDLIKQCVLKHSNEGDIVFDGFAGSATTAIAARNMGRQYICIEKDKEYYEVAKKRLETGDDSILIF